MKGRRFQGRCLFCGWLSILCTGPVFAGNIVMKHVKENHPAKEGFVALIQETKKDE